MGSAIVAAFTPPAPLTHPLTRPRPTCLHRTPRKHGRASKMSSHDGALDSEVRAEADHRRVSLAASEDFYLLAVESGWRTMRCSTSTVVTEQSSTPGLAESRKKS